MSVLPLTLHQQRHLPSPAAAVRPAFPDPALSLGFFIQPFTYVGHTS